MTQLSFDIIGLAVIISAAIQYKRGCSAGVQNNLVTTMKGFAVLALAVLIAGVCSQKDTHQWANRNTIVHLFEWKWDDIADECERFLAPKGYGGVQVRHINRLYLLVP